jgi:HEAT repeat protein
MALVLGMGLSLPGAEAAFQESAAPSGTAGDSAATELEALGTRDARALAGAIRAGEWQRRREPGGGRFHAPGALSPLLRALRDDRPTVRRLALWGISELRAGQAGTVVAQFLNDAAPEVRAEAARTLGDLGATGEALRIAALLRDRDSFVRLQAAHALGDLQHPATRPPLQAALDDPDEAVRSKARWALLRVAEAERVLRRHGRVD